MQTVEELIHHACQLSPQERQRLVAAVEASLVAEVVATEDAFHDAWATEIQAVLAEFRQGAADYSADEIDQIVDAAVEAVRRGQRPIKT
jgi:predicted sugar kinase